ncbi:MAG: ASKHA domain-containing protein [Nitrospirota bacterium]
MRPLVTAVDITLDRPSPSDKRADRERLLDGLVAQGITAPVEIDIDLLRILPSTLRVHDFRLQPTLGFTRDMARVLSFGGRPVYALAVDIGTTNIVASLVDVLNNKKISTLEYENPQVEFGLDVLTRVHLAMSGKAATLHEHLVSGLNTLIQKLCAAQGTTASDIYAAAFAGNTIMTHFLLNLPVHNIPVEPYIPAAHRIDFMEPKDIGLKINDRGIIYVFPNAGSYVGGDIISGILASGLYKEEQPTMLIDVGTNAEIVLGCSEWIMVGAGAAGPALEGGISEIGMRAAEGAVYNVEIDKNSHEVHMKIIGNSEPRGICGTGMIALVSELYTKGIINQQGKFIGFPERIRDVNGRQGFVLYESDTVSLIIKDTDIDNFLRSKAAMFSSLYVMVKSVGLRFGEIHKIYMSGAFGAGIDADKAVAIGMIPDIERSRLIAIGNSSLKGAEMLLMERELLPAIDRIGAMITYKEMNTEGDFMKEFPAALFLPHTDPEVLKG